MKSSPLYRRYLEVFCREIKTLVDKPEETPETALIALWHAAAGDFLSIEAARDRPLRELSSQQAQLLRSLVKRRLSGEPLAHLIRRQRFMGLDFKVGPQALVPRKETELLGKTVVDLVKSRVCEQGNATLLDVCTGVGNVAIAAANFEPRVSVFASDISEEAIGLARENAAEFSLHHRIVFKVGDLFGPFHDGSIQGGVDVLSCNPPYISTGKLQTMSREIVDYEPVLAFDGGPFGLKILSRVFKESIRFLKSAGHLCFEVGLGQGPGMVQLLKKSGNFSSVTGACNAKGEIRVVIARR